MGQYHLLVNLSKKQVVNPHKIGNGLKLREQVGWDYSTSTALVMLLAASNGRGGGDFNTGADNKLIGSWAGDKIAFIGDYAERHDVKGFNAPKIYEIASRTSNPEYYKTEPEIDVKGWTDISAEVREMMTQEFGIKYKGEGWLDIEKPQ